MNQPDFVTLLSARLAAADLSLSVPLIEKLETYFNLLTRWNSRINLTGFSLNPLSEQAIDRLIVEPLSLAKYTGESVGAWVDLGSGGGSPAIPLYLFKPAGQLLLVESKHRKAAFLRQAIRELELKNVGVEVSRIESITPHHPLAARVDLVTLRAVQPSESVLSTIRHLLNEDGRALLVGSPLDPKTIPSALKLVNNLGFMAILTKESQK